MSLSRDLFATKSVDRLRADAEHETGLKRALTALDLVMLGIGAIIGTGIFVLTGRAAAANAGPAVALSAFALVLARWSAHRAFSLTLALFDRARARPPRKASSWPVRRPRIRHS